MSKFFKNDNSMFGFEDYLRQAKKNLNNSNDLKKYDQGKIYSFLEYNYVRLKKVASFLHKKIINIHEEESADLIRKNQIKMIKIKKEKILENICDDQSNFQKNLARIYANFSD